MTMIGNNLPMPVPLLSPGGAAPKSDEPERSFADELRSLIVPSTPLSSFVGVQSVPDPAQVSVASTAQVFNELGLFGTATTGPLEPAAAGDPAMTGAQVLDSVPLAPGNMPAGDRQGISTVPRSILLTRIAAGLEPPGAAGLPEASFRTPLPLKVPGFSLAGGRLPNEMTADQEPERITSDRMLRRSEAHPSPEPDRSPVSVVWDGRGVTAVVPAATDTSSHRLRLRDKALGLIARLGFLPATIRVGARTHGRPAKED